MLEVSTLPWVEGKTLHSDLHDPIMKNGIQWSLQNIIAVQKLHTTKIQYECPNKEWKTVTHHRETEKQESTM